MDGNCRFWWVKAKTSFLNCCNFWDSFIKNIFWIREIYSRTSTSLHSSTFYICLERGIVSVYGLLDSKKQGKIDQNCM